MVLEHRRQMEDSGHFAARRSRQALEWMRELVALGLEDAFRHNAAIAARLPELQEAVRQGRTTPFAASRELLALFRSKEY
jgi:LAO/AO transport system kinase